jgi:hypothetical protein
MLRSVKTEHVSLPALERQLLGSDLPPVFGVGKQRLNGAMRNNMKPI